MVSHFLEGLERSEVRAVVAAATPRRFSPHAIICEQEGSADEFFLLSNGRARFFSISPDGRKTIMHWLVPGDILGLATLLLKPSRYRLSAETVHESTLLIWSRERIRTLLDRYPRLCQNALSTGADYLDWYIAAHGALASETAPQRLASVLAHLASAIGRQVAGGVELRITNEELANAANITTFTASRILSGWQAERAVTKRRGSIILHSAARLFLTA